jgi:molecular chaperone DnaK
MPAPRGVPRIEVTLDIDAERYLISFRQKIRLLEKRTKFVSEGGSQLSKEEIERMKKEAEANA